MRVFFPAVLVEVTKPPLWRSFPHSFSSAWFPPPMRALLVCFSLLLSAKQTSPFRQQYSSLPLWTITIRLQDRVVLIPPVIIIPDTARTRRDGRFFLPFPRFPTIFSFSPSPHPFSLDGKVVGSFRSSFRDIRLRCVVVSFPKRAPDFPFPSPREKESLPCPPREVPVRRARRLRAFSRTRCVLPLAATFFPLVWCDRPIDRRAFRSPTSSLPFFDAVFQGGRVKDLEIAGDVPPPLRP